ncbi:carboxymuconolactone decarboxylase family protein [Salinarimonas soli]|nr:carboxymuconolactone decarboxylase family protein [Salinarimonas soli]
MSTAPEASREALEVLAATFGLIPNIAGAMATSPVLINCLVSVFGKVHGGSLSEPEIQVLLLTNAVTNRSEWASAFHSALALQQGISAADVDAIRSRSLPGDPRLAALSALTRALIERRGKLGKEDVDAFLAPGFAPHHLLEVIAVSAASTITNYTANVTTPQLETAFAEHAWRAA